MGQSETTGIFSDRLEDLIKESGKTLDVIAKEAGIKSKATLTKYQNNEAEAGINYLVKLAKYFNVSTDYILGLTNVKSPDIKLKAVCEYTGLSESAVKSLLISGIPYIYEGFNEICKSSHSFKLFRDILCYLNSSSIEARKAENVSDIFFEQENNIDNSLLIDKILYKIEHNGYNSISHQLLNHEFWEPYFLMAIQNELKDLKNDITNKTEQP